MFISFQYFFLSKVLALPEHKEYEGNSSINDMEKAIVSKKLAHEGF